MGAATPGVLKEQRTRTATIVVFIIANETKGKNENTTTIVEMKVNERISPGEGGGMKERRIRSRTTPFEQAYTISTFGCLTEKVLYSLKHAPGLEGFEAHRSKPPNS
jgi:hypothetical protein